MIDYHLHGDFCGHATGDLEEYVRTAIEKGFREIGFSDHLPKVVDPDPYHAMLEDELPRYVERVLELRERYRDEIRIKLGIEADHFPGYEDRTARLLEAHPFDYVLGSIHYLGDWHFTSKVGLPRYETEDPAMAFPAYFELLRGMIDTGLFDVVAHPDALRRKHFTAPEPPLEEYRSVAKHLQARGMSLELNTGGIRRGTGSVYPEEAFLRICVAAGIPVTLGSDAHAPQDVGRDYAEAYAALALVGVREVATYERRRLVLQPLAAVVG